VNPKEVSAARLTGDPRRDEDGDDKDHGVTGDGGSHAPTKHARIKGFFGSLQKPCKYFCMTIGRLMPWFSATLEFAEKPLDIRPAEVDAQISRVFNLAGM